MATWEDILSQDSPEGFTDPKPNIPWYADLAGNIASMKLASMGLAAAGVSTGAILPAVIGAGLWGIGSGLYEGKGAGEIAAGAIPDMAMQAAWGGAGKVLAPIWKARKPIMEGLRSKGLSELLTSGDARWDALKPAREAISNIELFKKGGFAAKIAGGSTLEDIFIPGAEGIPKKGATNVLHDFVKEQNIRGNVAQVSKELNSNIAGLDLLERAAVGDILNYAGHRAKLPTKDLLREPNIFETVIRPSDPAKRAAWDTGMSAYEGWAGLALPSQEKVIAALDPLKGLSVKFDNILGNTKAQFLRASFSDQFMKAIEKEPMATSAGVLAVKEALDLAGVSPEVQGYKLQVALKKVIGQVAENPDASLDLKNTLKFMHDTPALGAEAVYNAGMGSSRELLYSQVKAYRAYTTTSAETAAARGFVKIKGPASSSFKDIFVEPYTAKAIEEISDIPSQGREMWNKYFFSPWKLWRVIGRFASQFRNIGGNFVQNDLYGENPLSPLNIPIYAKAWQDLRGRGPFSKELEKMTGLTYGGFVGAEFSNIAGSLRHDTNMFDVALGYSAKVAEPFTKAHSFFESWAKVAKYMYNREQGMGKWDGAIDAIRATFNYGEVTHATRVLRETVMPFGTWQMKTLRAFPEALVKHPLRVAKYVALPAAITAASLQNLNISNDEWSKFKDDLPEYIQNKMFFLMPFRDEKNRLQLFDLTWWLPGLGDISDLGANVQKPLSLIQNPVVNLIGELQANRKHSGAPIWYEWQDGNTKMAKATHHIYQNVMPTWIPGGTDWMQIQNAAQDKPNSLTLAQSIASAGFGLKMSPFEEGPLAAKKARLQEQYKRELIGQMKKDMAQATTDKERQKLVIQYQSWLQNIYERPNPEE